jgi:ParB family transcriptional regulator, chromosome partitioning protein
MDIMKGKTTMNQPQTLQWDQLDLRYADIRIHTQTAINRLVGSIQSHGLLNPIIVVPLSSTESSQRWVVIDGYLRVAALLALRHDNIEAVVSSQTMKEALIDLYRQSASRVWEAYEEAQLVQTLIGEHQCSLTEVSRQLGKSKSWVSYRLQLLQDLPEFVEQALRQGIVSTWTTQRIILPFARANSEGAKKLLKYLGSRTHASRDIQAYYTHYLSSNRHTRQMMQDEPHHFFKAYAFQMKSDTVPLDQLAPEEAWEGILTLCLSKLKQLERLLPAVFYPKQKSSECSMLMKPLSALVYQVQQLQKSIEERHHV